MSEVFGYYYSHGEQKRYLPLPQSSAGCILTYAAINLLDKLLQFDPDKRCSAVDALESQYLAPYHDPEDEPAAPQSFDWSFLEVDLPADIWKIIIYAEVLGYHEQAGGASQLTGSFNGLDLG